MTQPGREVLRFIGRVRARQAMLAAITWLALGALFAAAVIAGVHLWRGSLRGMQADLLSWTGPVAIVFAVAGALAAWGRARTPIEIERRAPESRNIVLTASELLAEPARATPAVTDLVVSRAADTVRALHPARLFPARTALITLAIATIFWLVTLGATFAGDPIAPVTLGAAPVRDEVGTIQVTVTPPAYTKRQAQRLTNPSRIEAMAGSRIDLTVRGDDVHVETLEGAVVTTVPNHYSLVSNADGFIAIRAGASDRRLIGLSVTPDQSPRVRITAPGKDMFLSDAKRRVPVDIDARDDLGLAALKLRYTKVSGSGERFTFVEGEIPVTVARPNDHEWTAKGMIDLAALKLEQGDMLVYRGAAADGRPGAALAESDAFIIEITSPLSAAASGFSVDDQQDKYALSQQMVILKTERLLARAATLPPDSLAYYSQNIAAEQRSVRAEFVFMMGGEVAEEVIAAADQADIDETKEAENESELAAGRMVNRGRVALVEAIRQMSRASTHLNNVDPRTALPVEKAALVALQQAFSRTRYILRALTQRERLDLSRRLTGVLSLAARDARPQANPPVDPAIVSLRRSLATIATCHPERREGSAPGDVQIPRCARDDIAQAILAVDPSDSTLQRVAALLGEARFDDAASALTQALRARLPREDAATESPGLRRLRGALTDAVAGRTPR
jgi:hypothetical protein